MKLALSPQRSSVFRRQVLPALISAVLASGWAQAQTKTPPADEKQDPSKVEAVTVTATKRAVPLQSVPIAITVIDGGQLERSNLNTLGAITSLTPAVNFRSGASNKDTSLFVRGVGTISTSPGIEPTVSTVVDGVVSARPGQATMDLLDVARIEVLRGPQGTLFGKNASAGVISIVSRAPTAELNRFIDLSYFGGNEKRLRAGISGALQPGVANASLSIMHGDYDGNVTNVFNGSKVNGYDRTGLRARVDLTPDRDLKISLIADTMKSRDNSPTGVPIKLVTVAYPSGVVSSPNAQYAAAISPVVPSLENRSISSDIETRVSDKNSGVSGQFDWNVGGNTITGITAYRKWDNTQFQDQDRMPSVYRQLAQTADKGQVAFTQTSQELRIASPRGAFFDYVAGVFFMRGKNAEIYQRDVTRCANSAAPALASGLVPCTPSTTTVDTGIANYGITNDSTSLFGEGTFNFTSELRNILGLRYTQDKLSYNHMRTSTQTAAFPGVQPATSSTGTTKETGVSGRIGPQYDLSKDVMAYATYSRGYKGPAYNVFFNMLPFSGTTPRDALALKPETSDSYEIGLKSTLLDNRLRLNIAAFNTKYANYQSNLPDLVVGTIVTRLINAGDVSTKGVEVDFVGKVSSQFTVSGAAARIIARVDKFNCPPGAAVSCDVNGKPLPYSPDWRMNLRASYKTALTSDWTIDYSADANWQSAVIYDIAQAPDAVQPSYGIINATVSVYNSESGWRFTLIGKNLSDKSYSTNLTGGASGSYVRWVPRDDRRYFGVNARYDF